MKNYHVVVTEDNKNQLSSILNRCYPNASFSDIKGIAGYYKNLNGEFVLGMSPTGLIKDSIKSFNFGEEISMEEFIIREKMKNCESINLNEIGVRGCPLLKDFFKENYITHLDGDMSDVIYYPEGKGWSCGLKSEANRQVISLDLFFEIINYKINTKYEYVIKDEKYVQVVQNILSGERKTIKVLDEIKDQDSIQSLSKLNILDLFFDRKIKMECPVYRGKDVTFDNGFVKIENQYEIHESIFLGEQVSSISLSNGGVLSKKIIGEITKFIKNKKDGK